MTYTQITSASPSHGMTFLFRMAPRSVPLASTHDMFAVRATACQQRTDCRIHGEATLLWICSDRIWKRGGSASQPDAMQARDTTRQTKALQGPCKAVLAVELRCKDVLRPAIPQPNSRCFGRIHFPPSDRVTVKHCRRSLRWEPEGTRSTRMASFDLKIGKMSIIAHWDVPLASVCASVRLPLCQIRHRMQRDGVAGPGWGHDGGER